MTLPDPYRSNAVLIGTSAYARDGFTEPPGIRENLRGLQDAITDPRHGGFRPERCTVLDGDLLSSPSPNDIVTQLTGAAQSATDTLLVYYAGHGIREGDDLYLTVPQTDPGRLETTAIAYGTLRRTLLRNRRWRRLVVILDCSRPRRPGQELAADGCFRLLEIEGGCVLAATSHDVGPGPYTAFTGALLEQLTAADPDLPPTLPLTLVAQRVDRLLEDGGQHPSRLLQPAPEAAGDLALTRNRAVSDGSCLVLDVRDNGVAAISRKLPRQTHPEPLAGLGTGTPVSHALQSALADDPSELGQVVLLVPADWDTTRRTGLITLAGTSGAQTVTALSRPQAAARFAEREWAIPHVVGTALLVHEQTPLGVCSSVVTATESGWQLGHTEHLVGARTHVEGVRLSNGVLIRSHAGPRVAGLVLITSGLSEQREEGLRAGLEFLEPPVHRIENDWDALALGALLPPAPAVPGDAPSGSSSVARSAPAEHTSRPPAPDPRAAAPQTRRRARARGRGARRLWGTGRPGDGHRLDRTSAAIAATFGVAGFGLFHGPLSVETLPAAAIATVATTATYLGRSPQPRPQRHADAVPKVTAPHHPPTDRLS